MSQQPPPYDPQQPQQPQQPYQPYQPYQQPYPPYAQGGYPNPYQGLPQRRDHTTRNVLLIIGGVMLLLCGGVVAFFVWVVDSIGDGFDRDFAGSSEQPLVVEEGEAFSIRGFDYEAGWRVAPGGSPLGELQVAPVRATNDREDEDTESVFLYFRLFRDNELLATVSCSGGTGIAHGRSVTLDCTSYAEDARGFDEIEVYDSSFLE